MRRPLAAVALWIAQKTVDACLRISLIITFRGDRPTVSRAKKTAWPYCRTVPHPIRGRSTHSVTRRSLLRPRRVFASLLLFMPYTDEVVSLKCRTVYPANGRCSCVRLFWSSVCYVHYSIVVRPLNGCNTKVRVPQYTF